MLKTLNEYKVPLGITLFGLIILTAGLANAQEVAENQVRVPWGELVATFVLSIGTVGAGLITFAKKYLPYPARVAVDVFNLDQVAKRSIEAAAFDFAEKIKTQGWTLEVRNEVLRTTINNAIATGNAAVLKYKDTLETKIKARLEEYITERLEKK